MSSLFLNSIPYCQRGIISRSPHRRGKKTHPPKRHFTFCYIAPGLLFFVFQTDKRTSPRLGVAPTCTVTPRSSQPQNITAKNPNNNKSFAPHLFLLLLPSVFFVGVPSAAARFTLSIPPSARALPCTLAARPRSALPAVVAGATA